MPAPGPNLWAYCVLAVTVIVAAVTDVRSGKIPNWVTYPAAAIGVCGHTLVWLVVDDPGALGPLGSLGGFAAGFGPLLIVWLAGGIGGGDAKLMGAVGALGGWWIALSALFYGLLVAAAMAVFVMVRRRIVRRTVGRVWRFLLLSFSPNRPGSPASADSPTIPFGLALCVGSTATLVELAIGGRDAVGTLLGL